MSSALNVVSRPDLYGPDRNLRYAAIRNRLSKSSVLQDGEYNYTNVKLRPNIWRTSNSTDFSGGTLNPSLQGTKSQLVHHFDMGNASGKLLETDIFRRSTTMTDFHEKPTCKPEIKGESKVINWPDMAPRYLGDRRVGRSEYTTSLSHGIKSKSAPTYPRVDTSKMQLPLDQDKFWRQRNTNLSLGCEDEGLISEHQRAFGRGSRAFEPDENDVKSASDIIKNMRELDKVSHVFRGGDYNDIVGNFVTTCNGDYGSRALPPGEAALKKTTSLLGNVQLEDEEDEEGPYARNNPLQKYARQNTVPQVWKDAADGRSNQENAHFNFGHDPEAGHTVYAKDFALSAMADRAPPIVRPPPSAGHLLQCDPNQSKHGITSSSVDFQNTKYEPYRDSKGKTALEMNLDRRDTDNVIFSYDLGKHTLDRQKSIAHSDYTGPPQDYRPPPLGARHDVYVDYLQTDDALPYPAPPKDVSEASHNFSGIKIRQKSASKRRTKRKKSAKKRWNDGLSTHFTVGYTPFDFTSETTMKFKGDPKTDAEVPAAGKTEKPTGARTLHLNHSANILDLQAADPHITNTRESLPARLHYSLPQPQRSNTTSIMKKDYGPLRQRSLTDAQLRVIEKYETLANKDISDSHLFHTDTSGRDNFRTTAMEDFIKPEHMTGRKFLAAR